MASSNSVIADPNRSKLAVSSLFKNEESKENLQLKPVYDVVAPIPSYSEKKMPNRATESRRPKCYQCYTNEFKIEFLKRAAEIGKKRAALSLQIPWSTAKVWITKDEEAKKKNDTYANQLSGIPICFFCRRCNNG